MADNLNVGGIQAELELDSGKLEQGLLKARRALDAIESEVRQLDGDLKRHSITTQDHAAKVAQLSAVYTDLASRMQKAYAAVGSSGTGLAGAGGGGIGGRGGLGNFSAIAQQAGYAIGDFASTSGDLGAKLMSISNNVQFAAAGFGVWGTAIGLASVGIAVLVRNVDSLDRALGEGTFRAFGEGLGLVDKQVEETRTRFERLEETIKRLEAKPVKLAIDRHDLDVAQAQLKEARRDQAAYDAAGESRPAAERESGAAVARTLAAAPGGEKEVRDALRRSVLKETLDTSPALRQAHDEQAAAQADLDRLKRQQESAAATPGAGGAAARIGSQMGAAEKRLDRAREQALEIRNVIAKGAEQTVGKLFADAKEGNQDGQKALAAFLTKNGLAGLAGRVEKGSADTLEDEAGRKRDEQAEQLENERQAKLADAKRQRKLAELHKYGIHDLDEKVGILPDDELDDLADRRLDERQQGWELDRQVRKNDLDTKGARGALDAGDARAENWFTRGLAGGLSPERAQAAVTDGIRAILKSKGYSDEAAGAAATDMGSDAAKKVRSDIARRALDGPAAGTEPERHSEVFAAAALHDKLQTAVTNAPLAQVPQKLDDIKTLLAQQLGATLRFK